MVMACWRFFFFSGRRRHTICSRDWSSDVCSSDLAELEIVVSYDQSWWPFGIITERNAFTAKRDSQRAVHWVHITPAEEKPLFPLSTPSSSRPAEWESFLWINVRSSCP